MPATRRPRKPAANVVMAAPVRKTSSAIGSCVATSVTKMMTRSTTLRINSTTNSVSVAMTGVGTVPTCRFRTAAGGGYYNPLAAVSGHVSDRSLDEFVTDGESEGNDTDPGAATACDGATADADADVETTDATSVDPAVPTMRWSGAGAACDACGATVARRWRDGEAFVCADCKAWD